MLRKHKIYSRPRKPFDKFRIDEEKIIKDKFGLKNKKEIWKAEAKLSGIRTKAKKMIYADEDEKNAFISKLNAMGLSVSNVSEVLSLTKNDIFERRLQTIVFEKKIAPSMKAARQMITHKKIIVDGGVVNAPSYFVYVDQEGKISAKKMSARKPKIESSAEDKKEINNE
jgi:small subunit ribosomal protein S4